jgi:hypothetical protein
MTISPKMFAPGKALNQISSIVDRRRLISNTSTVEGRLDRARCNHGDAKDPKRADDGILRLDAWQDTRHDPEAER